MSISLSRSLTAMRQNKTDISKVLRTLVHGIFKHEQLANSNAKCLFRDYSIMKAAKGQLYFIL